MTGKGIHTQNLIQDILSIINTKCKDLRNKDNKLSLNGDVSKLYIIQHGLITVRWLVIFAAITPD